MKTIVNQLAIKKHIPAVFSMIVAVVRVILVGYVMFGSKELDVIMSQKVEYVIFSLIFNRFMLKSPDIINH